MAEAAAAKKDWWSSVSGYFTPRMMVILAMGFASGLPLLLTLSTLSYWLSKVGVDKTTIGLFALVGAPYTFKFLWSPIIDQAPRETNLPLLATTLPPPRPTVPRIENKPGEEALNGGPQ